MTESARQEGFRLPVAMTAAAYHEGVTRAREAGLVNVDHGEGLYLAGLLDCLFFEVGRAPKDADRVTFKIERQGLQAVDLYAVCGPGDRGEPVVTVMLVGED